MRHQPARTTPRHGHQVRQTLTIAAINQGLRALRNTPWPARLTQQIALMT
jgi:hypothetical protein